VHDQIEEFKRMFERINLGGNHHRFSKYYIVIHSMDAGALKNEEW